MMRRQIGFGMLISLAVFTTVMISSVIVFPVDNWKELTNRKIMDIPFILFIPSISLAIGIIFGTVSGYNGRKQFQKIDIALHELEEGRGVNLNHPHSFDELNLIFNRIGKIQRQISEQTMLSQKLANEKAIDQETRIQEIISEERNRLARELHDSVSQQLFAASMMMSAINETNSSTDEREKKQLQMVESMIHQSQLEMRALLLHLRPIALKGKTIQEGMEELLTELSQKVAMTIKWKIEDFSIDKGVEDHLFRILQEAVSNTLRHSKACKLEVLLISRDDVIILRVVDDGIGFDVEESRAGSYGMQNMHERAVEIGGTMKIISIKDQGTRLEVKIPILARKGETND